MPLVGAQEGPEPAFRKPQAIVRCGVEIAHAASPRGVDGRGALLISAMDENAESFLATCFVLLALPGFALSLAQLFGRDGDEPKIGWGKRLGGVVLLVVGIMLVLGMLL